MPNNHRHCCPIAFYCAIFAFRVDPQSPTLSFFRSCSTPMIFFEDIIRSSVREDASNIAIAQFWKNMRIESTGKDILKRQQTHPKCLPDNLLIDCSPIYEHQIRMYALRLKIAWEELISVTKSFNEMREAFTQLGVIEIHPNKIIRKE